jgi:hypothetical protein
MARQSELDELRSEVNKLKNQASKPMTDADYKAIGIEFPASPLSNIEDVGAAPPKLDPPASAPASPAPAAQGSASAPATHSNSTV